MELRLLKYFVTLCEEKNYVRAAKRLFITQPTLSQQMKLLEENCQVKLFQKHNKQLTLTKAGELLYFEAQNILKHVNTVSVALQDLSHSQANKITLYSSGCHFFTEVLYQFSRQYPTVSVKMDESSSRNVVKHILDARASFGAAYLSLIEPNDSISMETLFEDQFVVVVNKVHPWSNKEHISLKEVLEQTLVLAKPGIAVRNMLDRFATEHNLLVTPQYEFPNFVPCLDSVQRNIGISLLPLSFLKFRSLDSIHILKISDPLPVAAIALIYRKDHAFSDMELAFIEKTKTTLKQVII